MSIELSFTDMCEGCAYAELEIDSLHYDFNKKLWEVHCIHHDACNQMAIRVKNKMQEEERRCD